MGVKDLTTFVNKHQQFFEDYKLHSTELVIDGYSIMSKLYFDSDVDSGNHGGEFQKFYDHCAKFWQKLHYCGIKPYVVFDGAYDMDGKKYETLKDRLQKKIDEVLKIKQGKHASIMPTMANEVFKKVLRDFQVQFAFCDFEADKDIALVANTFECPVLAEDSDFFIMDIKQGFIHFDKVIWSNQETQNVIECEKYQLNKFCDYFKVESCLMPLFASVCGNDYLELLNLDNFFSATKKRNQCEPDERSHPRHTCEGDTKFCKVLHHFTYYQTYQECLKMIVEHVPRSERETTKVALSASCKMYVYFKESPIVKFFEEADADLSTNLLVTVHGIPELFLKSLRKGEVPMICLKIYLNRKYFLGAQVENIEETRSSYCSQDLLRVLAGIMLGAAAKESETLKIEIYDREKEKRKCFKVEPLYKISGICVPLFTSSKLTSKKEENRVKCRQFLLACLEAKDMTMDGIPEQFQLVLVVTVYWLHHAQQTVPHNLLVALVLGWIQGVAWCLRKNTLYGLDERLNSIYPWPNHESVFNNFCYLAKKPLQKSLNLGASHSLAQWLACICSAEDINALLMHVFPRADMTVFFNGLLIHNLYYTLPKFREDHEEWIGKLLPRNSYGRNLYDSLIKFLSSKYKGKQPIREDQWQDVQ